MSDVPVRAPREEEPDVGNAEAAASTDTAITGAAPDDLNDLADADFGLAEVENTIALLALA